MNKLKHELRILRAENQKLRNEVEMIRKHYAIHRSALVEIVNLSSLSPMINDIARKSLADTGTRGCPVGPVGVVGKNGLVEDELDRAGIISHWEEVSE